MEKSWKIKKLMWLTINNFQKEQQFFCENNEKFNLKKILPFDKWRS